MVQIYKSVKLIEIESVLPQPEQDVLLRRYNFLMSKSNVGKIANRMVTCQILWILTQDFEDLCIYADDYEAS